VDPRRPRTHVGFTDLADARNYFSTGLRLQPFPGKFRVTRGKINQDEFQHDERLIFTFDSRIIYTANAGSTLQPNEDDPDTYPSYFVIDLSTLLEANLDGREFEEWYRQTTGAPITIVNAQGWNHIPDTTQTDQLWLRLRDGADSAELPDLAGDSDYIPDGIDRRELVQRQIKARRGQPQFREALLNRYASRCVVTGCEIVALLEAAHINPHRSENDNHPANGLLLRADIHTLFDLHLLGIEPDTLRIELNPTLVGDLTYAPLASDSLKCSSADRPTRAALVEHHTLFVECKRRTS